MEYLVTAKMARAAVFATAVHTGRPVDELAQLSHVPAAALTDPDARMPHAQVVTMWDILARETHEPALGLVAAKVIDNAAVDRLEPLLAQAETLGHAMQIFVRFQRLYHTGNASRSELLDDHWKISFALQPAAAVSSHMTDFVLANWVLRLRRAAKAPVPILRAQLRRSQPQRLALYREVFGTATDFAADEDALTLARDTATLPIAGANPAVRRILEAQANAELDALDPKAIVLHEVRAALETTLIDGPPSLDRVARVLATSSRTLQRRLATAGSSFQALVDQTRHELALTHLERGESLTDTSFLLGFSEPGAFSRAFRRWTGHSPRTQRRAV